MTKLFTALFFLLTVSVHATEAPSQCDSAAEQAARVYVHQILLEQGSPSRYPGPEVVSFIVLSPDNLYRISLSGQRPMTLKIETAQKSYYCAILKVTEEN